MDPTARPLTVTGSDPARAVTFPLPVLLAPMEGVTDRTFRSLVLDLGHVGGACTEFVRISQEPVPDHVLARELDEPHPATPVGVQLMAPGPEHVAATVQGAERVGAAFIDLNFGCPVKRVCGKGAGSALLDTPRVVEEIVRAAADATGLPVTAKIRAGVADDSRLDEVLDAVAAGGAAMLTIHARRRVDSYATAARWDWIARAVERLQHEGPRIPVVGNGGIDGPGDVARMLAQTGCAGAMIGRAAIADPFIFRRVQGLPPATAGEAARFALAYLEAIQPDPAATHRLGRFKQLVRYYTAGDLFAGREDERRELLRARTGADLRGWFESAAAAG